MGKGRFVPAFGLSNGCQFLLLRMVHFIVSRGAVILRGTLLLSLESCVISQNKIIGQRLSFSEHSSFSLSLSRDGE
jgi:hypothetical protein